MSVNMSKIIKLILYTVNLTSNGNNVCIDKGSKYK